MNAVRFQAVIGADRVIRPPKNVKLPAGTVEVIILRPDKQPAAEKPQKPKRGRHLVDRLARLAEQLKHVDIPADLAENHDHYAHGAPKGIDKL